MFFLNSRHFGNRRHTGNKHFGTVDIVRIDILGIDILAPTHAQYILQPIKHDSAINIHLS